MNHDMEVIASYLKNEIAKGKEFFKSKFIARALGMSSRSVGVNIRLMQDIPEETGVRIEEWAHCKSATWRVEVIA